jgi:glycosyltransferase involved in cell wall biosynthesis
MSAAKGPLVSVVMPILDTAAYLPEAIDSILAQTHDHLELILIDDGSSDASPQIVARYADADRRVRPIYLTRDPSLRSGARARNVAIATARGTYVAAMDSDDIALPQRIAAQLDHMQRHALDVCGAQAQAFGRIDQLFWFAEDQPAIERELVFRVGLLHPTVLATTQVMRDHLYDPGAAHDDYEWQTRVAPHVRMGNVPEILLRHRTHAAQSNQLHRAAFDADLRRHRFGHVYRLFPRTPPQDYRVLSLIAEHRPLHDAADVRCAAEWLIRLADLPDPRLHTRMARRWADVCDAATVPVGPEWRAEIAGRIDPARLPA